jgi:hypothetical protein
MIDRPILRRIGLKPQAVIAALDQSLRGNMSLPIFACVIRNARRATKRGCDRRAASRYDRRSLRDGLGGGDVPGVELDERLPL